MAQSFFSIDIGEKYIKVADIVKNGAYFTSQALAYEELPVNPYVTEGDKAMGQVTAILTKLVHNSGIKKKAVNLIIPDGHSYSRVIEMPLLTEKELVSAIKYQADQFVPIPIDKVSLDIEILSTDKKNKKLQILIIASPTTTVDRMVNLVESVGLIPEALENESSATLRLLADLYATSSKSAPNPQQSLTLFVNVGYTTTSIYLFDPISKLPRDIHNFLLGVEIFAKSIKANFNVADADVKKILETVGFADNNTQYNLQNVLGSTYNEFVAELARFIVSTKSKYNVGIDSIYLTGEGYKINGLSSKLTTSLGIKTQLFDIYPFFSKNNVIDFFKADLPLFIPVLGGNLR